MFEAVVWGAVAASSLVIGATLAFVRRWPAAQVGLVLAFGAGALVSAVSFELVADALETGSLAATGAGLAGGALTYFLLNGLIDRRAALNGTGDSVGGTSLALGAFLDGIPEQLVLGIGLTAGAGVSPGLLAAIFVSNLPEAIGSATEMDDREHPRGRIIRLWLGVAFLCALATVAGYLLADAVSGNTGSVINGFAAGALLVMLVDSMIPDATKNAGNVAGLVTTLGFAVAMALSAVS